MRQLFILALIVCSVSYGLAQQASSTFSLNQARTYAAENNFESKKSEKDLNIATQQYRQYLSMGLPQIFGSGGYNYNIQVPVFLLPASFFGGPPGTFETINAAPPFQTNIGVTATATVFDGSYIIGVKAAKTFRELSVEQRNKSLLMVKEDVTRAYYGAMVLKESMDVLKKTVDALKKTLFEVEQYQKNGFREVTDVEQMKLTVDQTEMAFTRTKAQYDMSLMNLKYQMGYPLDQPIEITDDFNSLQAESPVDYILNSETNSFTPKDNIDIRILNMANKAARLNHKVEFSKAFPTLSTFLNYSYAGFNSDRKRPVLFSSGSQYYNAGSTWGFSLNVPIFTSLNRYSSIKKAKLEAEKSDLQLKQAEEGLKLAYANATTNYKIALQSLNTDKSNRNLSEKILETNRVKFREGLISSFELTQAETQYLQTLTSYFTGIYNLLNTKLEYDKITNKL